jgi:hypothetical protein
MIWNEPGVPGRTQSRHVEVVVGERELVSTDADDRVAAVPAQLRYELGFVDVAPSALGLEPASLVVAWSRHCR